MALKEGTTKVLFTLVELEFIIQCMEDDQDEKWDGYGIEDRETYKDYKREVQLINRLKRSAVRAGGEQEPFPQLKIMAWAEKNNSQERKSSEPAE